jgi:phosphoribosylformylglycinamidine synthase
MPELKVSEIRRVFIEKKAGFDIEAQGLKADISSFLGAQFPELNALKSVRILNRYDTAHLDEAAFKRFTDLVLSEPQCDQVYYHDEVPASKDERFFGIEYLPGQYDQRADSAEQCGELVVGIRPIVRNARIYVFSGNAVPVSDKALSAIKAYLINPVDSREASLEKPDSLEQNVSEAPNVPILSGFITADNQSLAAMAAEHGFAMSLDDLRCCQNYFKIDGRDPSLAELKVLDTYWSDHCRHTTFTTVLENIEIEDGQLAPAMNKAFDLYHAARKEVYGDDESANAGTAKKRTLMDLATIGTKVLKKRGLCSDLDESKEINACSIKVDVQFDDGTSEPWLLLFKNETHNHPTEIEPFGGAATCLGGAIRDPLSGRAYVHQSMRITGSADPRAKLSDTIPGKLPQLKIARDSSAGYSSYGNQIGLAAGQVVEFYHPGFAAKRMELGAVIGAVPANHVRREEPLPGDVVLLIGGKTGRDGIGGATGSSKVHTQESVDTAGAEVQKGNAVEERKLQRLFRNPKATRLIKRCNDFGAGGVSVAVGELAAGLDINLDAVPRKYEGLDGIALAISESQERMAVVVSKEDANELIALAAKENLSAVVIAQVTADDGDHSARLRMFWRGKPIIDLARSFLDSNGAPRSAQVCIAAKDHHVEKSAKDDVSPSVLLDMLEDELKSLRSGSRRGLQERFDGSIGAGSVLFPWGGKEQGTPECGMAALFPSLGKTSLSASLMSFGYNPDLAQSSPYRGAKAAVREAVAKFVCLGGKPGTARLSFQEYFERMESPASWGKPFSALLGALEAQLVLGLPAIGGKDSMSGSYKDSERNINLAVPPTLVAFAAGSADVKRIHSGALSGIAGNPIILFYQHDDETKCDEWESFTANMKALSSLQEAGLVKAAYAVTSGGVAAALALMSFGNMTGVEALVGSFDCIDEQDPSGAVLVEIDETILSQKSLNLEKMIPSDASWILAGMTISESVFRMIAPQPLQAQAENDSPENYRAEVSLDILRRAYEYPLLEVYPQTASGAAITEDAGDIGLVDPRLFVKRDVSFVKTFVKNHAPYQLKGVKPLVILPVFPGTNCEYDMERAFKKAGAETKMIIFRNRDGQDAAESTNELAKAIREAQIVALSGGFSAGDEPDGSAKFMANAFRAAPVMEAVTELMNKRDGLMIGICNGFQALIKLGLVPYGEYRDADPSMPTLTFNSIGRHISRMVRTKVMSNQSPWLAKDAADSIHLIPISHGEGRIAINAAQAEDLFQKGQVAFCYTDEEGRPVMTEPHNPNGSGYAIEGLLSPDGRILGKMGHSERCGEHVHINIPGNKIQHIFEAGVAYFAT